MDGGGREGVGDGQGTGGRGEGGRWEGWEEGRWGGDGEMGDFVA